MSTVPGSPWQMLTKRELLAAMAMQGLCANALPGFYESSSKVAITAVKMADALVAQLSKEPHP